MVSLIGEVSADLILTLKRHEAANKVPEETKHDQGSGVNHVMFVMYVMSKSCSVCNV